MTGHHCDYHDCANAVPLNAVIKAFVSKIVVVVVAVRYNVVVIALFVCHTQGGTGLYIKQTFSARNRKALTDDKKHDEEEYHHDEED